MIIKKSIIILTIILVFFQSNILGQELDESEIHKITLEVITAIDENYIIPDIKKKIVSQLTENLKSKKYSKFQNPSDYAKVITDDLQKISGDYHLYLLEDKEDDKENPQPQRQMIRNFPDPNAFKNLITYELLPGNIAYIEIPLFGPLQHAKEDFDRALEKASKADAIIFDVSKCRGGSGETIAYVIGGYIETPTHLTTYYSKDGELKLITPKTKFGSLNKDKDIYVITDLPTGSAGEGFAFYPQQQGKVTVVGQVSRGAGNSNTIINLSNNFLLSVSIRTSITPNGGQIQGVGVIPDIFTPTLYAKQQAHIEAISSLMKKRPEKANSYNEILRQISKSLDNEITIDAETKKSIEETVLGYIENFFENKTDEMFEYLHPELAKRGMTKKKGQKTLSLFDMSNEELIAFLGKKKKLERSQQRNTLEILDVFHNTASVRLKTGYPDKQEWIEYIHLIKLDGKWQIINIIWDYYPRKKSNKK